MERQVSGIYTGYREYVHTEAYGCYHPQVLLCVHQLIRWLPSIDELCIPDASWQMDGDDFSRKEGSVCEAYSGTPPQLLSNCREQKVQSLEILYPEQAPSNDMPLA